MLLRVVGRLGEPTASIIHHLPSWWREQIALKLYIYSRSQALHPTRQRSSHSPPWEPEIWPDSGTVLLLSVFRTFSTKLRNYFQFNRAARCKCELCVEILYVHYLLMKIQNEFLKPGYSLTSLWSRTRAAAAAAAATGEAHVCSCFSCSHVDVTTWFFPSRLVTQILIISLKFVHCYQTLMYIAPLVHSFALRISHRSSVFIQLIIHIIYKPNLS